MNTTPMNTSLAPPLEQRVLNATTGALELFGIYLGTKLGLYAALQVRPGCTATELSVTAGIATRYAQEWLDQQAVAGVLDVDDATGDAHSRRYSLPEAHVGVVLDPVALDHVAPLAHLVVGIASVLDDVADAYRSGGGVPYSRYGADFRAGQGGINRPAFSSALVEEWLPALGPAAERLACGGRLADLGSGQGWSTIAVPGLSHGGGVGVRPRCGFRCRRACRRRRAPGRTLGSRSAMRPSWPRNGPYDVVLMLEALHDLARPVDVLRSARAALVPDGVLLVADEAVAPRFTAPGNDLERMMYGWSITHCLPAALAEQPSAATGTVLREDALRQLAATAGFGNVEVLEVDGGFFRIYALRP